MKKQHWKPLIDIIPWLFLAGPVSDVFCRQAFSLVFSLCFPFLIFTVSILPLSSCQVYHPFDHMSRPDVLHLCLRIPSYLVVYKSQSSVCTLSAGSCLFFVSFTFVCSCLHFGPVALKPWHFLLPSEAVLWIKTDAKFDSDDLLPVFSSFSLQVKAG